MYRALSIAVFAIAALTDFFDGYLARQYGVESKIGVFLDPLADKFLTFAGFLCLPFTDPELFPWWAIAVIVVRDIIITVLRLVADRKNFTMKTRFMAKLKTTIQMIFLYVFLLLGVFLNADVMVSGWISDFYDTTIPYYLMMLVVVITVYSGIEYLLTNPLLFSKAEYEQS